MFPFWQLSLVCVATGQSIQDVQDVAQTVRLRISEDEHRIKGVADRLLGVKDDVDRVGKEFSDKEFDMESLTSFLSHYQADVNLGESLGQDVARLNSEITSLTDELKKVNEELVALDAAPLAPPPTSVSLQQAQTELRGLRGKLKRKQELGALRANLMQADTMLLNKNKRVASDEDNILQELETAREQLTRYQTKSGELKHAILNSHNYGTKCSKMVGYLQGQVRVLQEEHADEAAKGRRAEQERLKPQLEIQHKNDQLLQRYEKARSNLQTVHIAQAEWQKELGALQMLSQAKISNLKGELNSTSNGTQVKEEALILKEQQKNLMWQSVDFAKGKVHVLETRIIEGELAELQANNTLFKQQLTEVHDALQKSQVSSEMAKTDAHKYNMVSQKFQGTILETVHATEQVSKETMQKVAESDAVNTALTQKAEEATLAAESSAMADCKEEWNRRHPKLTRKLEACPKLEDDLATLKAEVAAFTNMVTAPCDTG